MTTEEFLHAGLATVLDSPIKSLTFQRCGGGDINMAYLCMVDGELFFVKVNHHSLPGFFAREKEGLEALSKIGNLNTPTPLATFEHENRQALIMTGYKMTPLKRAGFYQAGVHLANCHQMTAEKFGWPQTNYLGTTPQRNDWRNHWIEFYVEQRLIVQLELLGSQKARSFITKLNAFEKLFDSYQPVPSLLHGDLWFGNLSATADGDIFYDPASYYGDRETDLAMTELFGGFPSAFYDGYESVWPLDRGYSKRKAWYQLYHLLNHANLFGGHYVEQSMNLLNQLTGRR